MCAVSFRRGLGRRGPGTIQSPYPAPVEHEQTERDEEQDATIGHALGATILCARDAISHECVVALMERCVGGSVRLGGATAIKHLLLSAVGRLVSLERRQRRTESHL